IKHTYPFCWRCDTPLLYYAKTSWYIKTTAVKERLVSANQEINWYPEHIKNGRFGDWLNNNVDWAISRERYWGTPLPFWSCESCGRLEAIGSVAELAERAGRPNLVESLDLHRPYVDDVTWPCTACSGTMRRTPEVIDVWFESGAMPVAQWHYPFEHQVEYETQFPADYICEAIDQTRGWFYSLHALGVLLRDQPAFKNVICLGHILDAKGEKMSKSRGNVVEPMGVLDAHGADALRWYLYTTSPPGSPRRFSADLVGEVVRKLLLTLWNTYSFFVIYANIDGFDPTETPAPADRSELDRWALSELHALIREVRDRLDNYDPTGAGRAIQAFLDDLSNWYVRRSRRRFWKSENDDDKWAAYHTLYECLRTLAHLLAPFTPFVAEELYQNLVRSVDAAAPESVHLASFPKPNEALIDTALMAETAVVQRVVSLGRAARSKAAIKVRQPLAEVVVKPRSPDERAGLERFADQVLEELNVKRLRFAEEEGELIDYVVKPNLPVLGPKYGKQLGPIREALKVANAAAVAAAVRANDPVRIDSVELAPHEVLIEVVGRAGYAAAAEAGYVVALSTEVTSALAREGLVREVVHRLQTMRKAAGFEIADTIVTYLEADPDLRSDLTAQSEYLKQETLSRDLVWASPPAEAYREALKVDGREILAGVRRT
ncbi:MAG TPA: class I tRNA ligase family protein, partial [Dehalococcoidia bacterium]|nr:class I tRNA ligase family protein [Dehalococcoidia bacterium]